MSINYTLTFEPIFFFFSILKNNTSQIILYYFNSIISKDPCITYPAFLYMFAYAYVYLCAYICVIIHENTVHIIYTHISYICNVSHIHNTCMYRCVQTDVHTYTLGIDN